MKTAMLIATASVVTYATMALSDHVFRDAPPLVFLPIGVVLALLAMAALTREER